MYTAGKITIATALSGLLVFAFIFLFNAGKTEIMKVEAQGSATTTLTVLNTPPSWVASSTELVESSATNPTNSGDVVSWVAVANDPNQANYYLLICSTSATPSSTNNGAPHCNGGTQWGVSAPTPVNTQAIVSTTTTEVAPFVASNNWFAWICDNDATFARCNSAYTNGTAASNTSPFIVNFRPTFDLFYNSSPANPGAAITFYSSSTDPDNNDIQLVVCRAATYSTTTNNCAGDTLATTSPLVTDDATAPYTIASIAMDQLYDAFGYIVDEFGHEAIGAIQGSNEQIEVLNVAPVVSSILINGGADIVPNQPLAETLGQTFTFLTTDANSCRTSSSTLEIVNFGLSFYQSPLNSTSTCNPFVAGDYDANDCYTSAVATTTWNLSCTASTTSCDLGGADPSMTWSCTFPVWHVINPTDAIAYYFEDTWKAGIAAIDDDNATGTIAVSVGTSTVQSVTGIELVSESIPYGQLEPGDDSGTLNASTTARSTGNTGLDHSIEGESMCGTFAVGNECPNSASSTIPEYKQQYATTSISYDGGGFLLTSSTPQLFQIGIKKSTSTVSASQGNTYWGIGVPLDITLAGSYTGLNTFYAVTAASSTWY